MSVKTLVEQILQKIPGIGRWQFKFMRHLLPLWLAMRGRYTFTNLARQGGLREDTYRQHFGRDFDFLGFNLALVQQYLGAERIIALDPCYVPKSGKHTDGVGYFYSGSAGREQWGLEFCGLAAVDTATKSALHLLAVQTVERAEGESMLEYYASIVTLNAERLSRVSRYVAADGFFACQPFVDRVVGAGFDLITRLRTNARLRYLYEGPHEQRRGRRRQYDGYVNPRDLRSDYFELFAQAADGSWRAYAAIVNVEAWKRNVRLVVVQHLDRRTGQVRSHTLLASTDPEMTGAQVLQHYQCRFQIEFLFRDAKQHAGLTHCQARSWQKIDFHLNTALTAVSLARVVHQLSQPAGERTSFSMADVKMLYANELLLNQFFSMCGINPDQPKIKSWRDRLRNFGRLAA